MNKLRFTEEFKAGVEEFLELAFRNVTRHEQYYALAKIARM